jgi:putative photosynthetic complex assembly protein
MSETVSEPGLPRGILLGAAALISFSLICVAAVRLGPSVPDQAARPVAVRDLHFIDQDDGSIVVVDAQAGRPIDTVQPGTGGFVRASLRGLVRDRRRWGVGQEPPFRLARMADGGIVLEDPSTGREVVLIAFGQTNMAAFAKWIDLPQPTQIGPHESK